MRRGIALLLTLALLFMLTACGAEAGEPTAPPQETENTLAAEPAPQGAVHYLNFKPEQHRQWLALAREYTARTGVPVTVHTPAPGTYEMSLAAELGREQPPTLFQVNGPVGLDSWQEFCYDLSDTQLYSHLISDSYALTRQEKVLAVAYVVETYGIIVNQNLLEAAGYNAENITSFEVLKAVAEDITARSGELGFAAFTSAGLDDSSAWRMHTHLANLPIALEYQAQGIESTAAIRGEYLDGMRNVFDLYLHNSNCDPTELRSKTGEDSRREFLEGKAVFYQNGSWEYGALAEVFDDGELTMLPIWTGLGDQSNQGLCTGTENYWCVNRNADPADIDATLDFLLWCVTSETGTEAMAEKMGFAIPFDTAAQVNNPFLHRSQEYEQAGKTKLPWSFVTIPSEAWKTGLVEALKDYAAGPTEENWAAVERSFIDGWAAEAASEEEVAQ